ncbi:hypothetical protein [Nocardioides sp. Kera G14]|uniref:hypothetical protein n=1 Tax=Nocardioides sp. Kera G14 TaxID=2884264 RepID=UPI001D12CB9C|nr:hypothetical protein [Nocardioides sp. Kera G14]UDY23016.1 hypothetical protein LH076_13220 [Nocardioides sp. Kera G14]
MSYDVVLLVEQALSPADATQVCSLHQEIADEGEGPVVYHVLLPMEDAAARIEASLGTLSGGGMVGSPSLLLDSVDFDDVRRECLDEANAALQKSLAALRGVGATAEGQVVDAVPVEALKAKVAEVDGREAIVLTAPHVVAEFFHVDWTHQARRALDVPVLHLLERENFDEQAGEGEGITGV